MEGIHNYPADPESLTGPEAMVEFEPSMAARSSSQRDSVVTTKVAHKETKKKQSLEPPQPPPPRSSGDGGGNGGEGDSARLATTVKASLGNMKLRSKTEKKVIGLKNYGLDRSTRRKRRQPLTSNSVGGDSRQGGSGAMNNPDTSYLTIEEMEDDVRKHAITNPFHLMFLGNVAALKVFAYYLVTLETFTTCGLTAGLTLYWYIKYKDSESGAWSGGSLDFILLSFVVISPISAAIGMAFQRRERALTTVANIRSFSYHVYLAHSLWDWAGGAGRVATEGNKGVDWLEHCDAVLAQLIGIGDELSRFLSLPTTSRSRHRLTRQGRREAARTIEVAYLLLESMTTQRITRLTMYSERLKTNGLSPSEVSRIRQYERALSDSVEQLRMVKMYRTPQALRSLSRLFTVLLPPYYAPAFAQVAIDLNSLGIGLLNGVIVALALTGLFLSLEILEDPFTAFLALDGIDVREEFEVLHFAQLIHTRELIFPQAPSYPLGRRAALRSGKKPNVHFTSSAESVGKLPVQGHVQQPPHHHRHQSVGDVPSVIGTPSIGIPPTQGHHRERRYVGSDIPSVIDASGMDQLYDDEEEATSLVRDATEYHADAELGYQLDDAGTDDGRSTRESSYEELRRRRHQDGRDGRHRSRMSSPANTQS